MKGKLDNNRALSELVKVEDRQLRVIEVHPWVPHWIK